MTDVAGFVPTGDATGAGGPRAPRLLPATAAASTATEIRPGAHALRAPVEITTERLLQDFFDSRSELTVRAYRADLRHLARFVGVDTLDDVVRTLTGGGRAHARALLMEARSAWQRRLAPATVNRRLAAVHALLELAEDLDVVPWRLRVRLLKVVPQRDCRGPGRRAIKAMLAAIKDNPGPRAARDRAIVRLLYDLGLRRGEVVGLDLEHVDLDRRQLWVRGKGRSQRERITLPGPTAAALRDWIAHRGTKPGALILNFDPTKKGKSKQRLTGHSMGRVLERLSLLARVPRARCHGLRHSAVTRGLDLTRGDARRVAKYGRHHSVQTTLGYDDDRRDVAGEIASLVADDLDADEDDEDTSDTTASGVQAAPPRPVP